MQFWTSLNQDLGFFASIRIRVYSLLAAEGCVVNPRLRFEIKISIHKLKKIFRKVGDVIDKCEWWQSLTIKVL